MMKSFIHTFSIKSKITAQEFNMLKNKYNNRNFWTKGNREYALSIFADNGIRIKITPCKEIERQMMELFSAHCFRHTFATRCFEAGIQPKTVQAYLGHATLQMTMDLYTAVMPKYLVSEMDKISSLYDSIEEDGDNIAEKIYLEKMMETADIIEFKGDPKVV